MAAQEHAPYERKYVDFEYFDENMGNPGALSTEQYVDSWKRGTIYDSQPGTVAVA